MISCLFSSSSAAETPESGWTFSETVKEQFGVTEPSWIRAHYFVAHVAFLSSGGEVLHMLKSKVALFRWMMKLGEVRKTHRQQKVHFF